MLVLEPDPWYWCQPAEPGCGAMSPPSPVLPHPLGTPDLGNLVHVAGFAHSVGCV